MTTAPIAMPRTLPASGGRPAAASPTATKLSVGIPVYNTARYFPATLDALLAQTYQEFELVISDNGSTDETESICRAYAAQDARIRYHRYAENRGAAWNFNNVFALTDTPYFKWAAADDLYAPTYLEECVRVLDEQPDVVLCYSRSQAVDAAGQVIKRYPAQDRGNTDSVAQRFAAAIINPHPFIPVFGVARREILARTMLIGGFSGSDRPLVGELALYGKLYEVPEFLFFYRHHQEQSWGGGRSRHQQQAWYDPRRGTKISFPTWRLLAEHEKSIWRTPLSLWEKAQCHGPMLRWVRHRWRYLANNLILRDI